MEKEIENIMNMAKEESLTQKERDVLRANVLSFMKEHPLSVSAEAKPVLSFYTFEFFVRRHSALAVFALVFFLSGTTSVFADKALPGDTLYPLKTSVNEKVLGWFATSPDSRAEWQLSLADRRLQEIQKLSVSEKMTPDIRMELEEKIDMHTELALGASTESLFEDAGDLAMATAEVADVNEPQNSLFMTAMAEPAPASAKMSARAVSSNLVDIEVLKARIAERRKSILVEKDQLKKEHLFVKRKAAVLVAEKLTLQADRARSEGMLEEADALDRKAESVISRIEPLSTEKENVENDESEVEVIKVDDVSSSTSGSSSVPTSTEVEVEIEEVETPELLGL